MNLGWNEKLSEEVLYERCILRGRARLAVLQQTLTLTYARKNVSEIARTLDCSKRKVIWMQHVLGLRTAQGTGESGMGTYPLEKDCPDA